MKYSTKKSICDTVMIECPQLPASASNEELLAQPVVRERFQQQLDELAAAATGSPYSPPLLLPLLRARRPP
jgi:hypothetical protein